MCHRAEVLHHRVAVLGEGLLDPGVECTDGAVHARVFRVVWKGRLESVVGRFIRIDLVTSVPLALSSGLFFLVGVIAARLDGSYDWRHNRRYCWLRLPLTCRGHSVDSISIEQILVTPWKRGLLGHDVEQGQAF